MTRRFAVGHKATDGDAFEVARPWGLPRNGAAAGGLVTSVSDLLAWARFHLRGARDDVEEQHMPDKTRLRAMHEPTLHMPGCAFGDAFGIGWFLSKVGNAWLISHKLVIADIIFRNTRLAGRGCVGVCQLAKKRATMLCIILNTCLITPEYLGSVSFGTRFDTGVFFF